MSHAETRRIRQWLICRILTCEWLWSYGHVHLSYYKLRFIISYNCHVIDVVLMHKGLSRSVILENWWRMPSWVWVSCGFIHVLKTACWRYLKLWQRAVRKATLRFASVELQTEHPSSCFSPIFQCSLDCGLQLNLSGFWVERTQHHQPTIINHR